MGIEEKIVIISTSSWEPLRWEDFRDIDFEELEDMPINSLYSTPEELYNDFQDAGGIITLPVDIEKEFLEWFKDILREYY